jgi:glutathione S-transferase
VIKIYGVPQSRAMRALWMANECGIKYENVPTSFTRDTRKPDYLKINPNGHIPTLVDDDGTIIWESMAVNLYLAQKYGGALWPKSLVDQAHAVQWSIWAMTEVEPPLMTILMNKLFLPEAQRDAKAAKAAEEALQVPLAVLDGQLKGRKYVLGDTCTVADINVASVLSLISFIGLKADRHANVARWFGELMSRPAARKAAGG